MADEEEDIRASAERLLRRVSMVSKSRSIGDGVSLEDSIRALQETHASMRDVEKAQATSVSTLGMIDESDASDDEEEAVGTAVVEEAVEAADPVRRPAARRSWFAVPMSVTIALLHFHGRRFVLP